MLVAKKKQARGFTLIELMVTVALVAIISAFAVPAISDWLARSAVRSLAESYQNGIRRAQVEAIKRNANAAFVLTAAQPGPSNLAAAANAAGPNWMIRLVDNAGSVIAGADSYINGEAAAAVGQASGAAGIAVAASVANAAAGSIVFSGFGRTRTAAVTAGLPDNFVIRVSSTTVPFARCVIVTPGGSINMCDPSVATGVASCTNFVTAQECAAP